MTPPLFVWLLIASTCHGPVLKVCEPVAVRGPFTTVEECLKAGQDDPLGDLPMVCERRAG